MGGRGRRADSSLFTQEKHSIDHVQDGQCGLVSGRVGFREVVAMYEPSVFGRSKPASITSSGQLFKPLTTGVSCVEPAALRPGSCPLTVPQRTSEGRE